MKHEKYDYSGYCGEQDEPVTRKESLIFWTAITAGVAVWSGFFFFAGYSIGAGS